MKPSRIAIFIAIVLALSLVIYIALRQPTVKEEMRDLRKDTKELGHDAAKGVNDAYDATKDAVHDAVK
jgi:hypothetical protein